MARHTEADYRASPLYDFALRTKLWRHFKFLRGVYRTYLKGMNNSYANNDYWYKYYKDAPISDNWTIDHGKDAVPTKIHYNSIENIILSCLDRHNTSISGKSVMDIGSGAGHWLDFYRSMGAQKVVGVELSPGAAAALEQKFGDDDRISVINAPVDQISFDGQFDIVNAIGVMFHIVDDQAFELSVEKLKRTVKPGGYLVVGGEFGLINNLNVQFDESGRVTKRLRSYRRWKQLLGPSWRADRVINRSYRLVNATLPEANILFARKSSD